MHSDEGVEDQKPGSQLSDGVGQAPGVVGEVEPQAGRGDDLHV